MEDLSKPGRSLDDVDEDPNIALVQEGAETQGRFEDQMGFDIPFKDAGADTIKELLNILVLVEDLFVLLVLRILMKQLHRHYSISEIILLMIYSRILKVNRLQRKQNLERRNPKLKHK